MNVLPWPANPAVSLCSGAEGRGPQLPNSLSKAGLAGVNQLTGVYSHESMRLRSWAAPGLLKGVYVKLKYVILSVVTEIHSQPRLRPEVPVGRRRHQPAVSALSPVHTDRRRTAKSQNLHKGRAGPQLRVSCPHSWRCHWGIHGELQKGGTKESSDV